MTPVPGSSARSIRRLSDPTRSLNEASLLSALDRGDDTRSAPDSRPARLVRHARRHPLQLDGARPPMLAGALAQVGQLLPVGEIARFDTRRTLGQGAQAPAAE